MSPQEIQQLLEAVRRAETQTQKKVLEKQKPKKAQNKKIEKRLVGGSYLHLTHHLSHESDTSTRSLDPT